MKVLKLFLLLILLSSALEADVWSKMFKVQKVDNSPQSQFEYGFQVGYQDMMDGRTQYVPSQEPFVKGYFEGRREAFRDIIIRSGNFRNNPLILNQEKGVNNEFWY